MLPTSYNGWPASADRHRIGVADLVVAGDSFPAGVKAGDVHVVMSYVLAQWHLRVERLHKGWLWGFSYRPNRNAPRELSCHASGTATDVNAPAHPNGKKGTFSARQLRAGKAILAEVGHVVAWGENFRHTTDGMHLEISGTPAQVGAAADWIRGTKKTKTKTVVAKVKAIATKRARAYPHDGKVSLANLHPGAHNPDVREVQRVLRAWFPNLSIDLDGVYGPKTQRAINDARTNIYGRKAKDGRPGRPLLRKLRFTVTR